jgi:flagellar assembly protein FliH
MSWWSSEAGGGTTPADWSWSTLTDESRSPVDEPDEASPPDPGYDDGFEDGLEEGGRRAMERLAEAFQAADEAARKVQEAQDALAAQLRDDVLVLALAVARQIVGRELAGDAETFADMVREALNAFPLDQKVKIRVHPADLSVISSANGEGHVIPITGNRDVQWIADPEMAPGGCLVEGPERVLDGRLDHTLERIYGRLSHG